MTPFTLAPYDASRRADYLRLLGDAWGDQALTADTFDWWFDGSGAESLRSVALRDDRVVGVAGHSLVRLALDGSERLGQFSVHAVTDPSARGLGIFQALELRHEEQGAERGSSCVLAFASAPTRPLFLGPLGWSQIDRRRVWARPAPSGRAGTRLETFGDAHERAYRTLAPSLRNHVVRDARYLNWRYAESPREYRLLGGAGGGFAVVGFTRRRGRRLGLLMELVGDRNEAVPLLRAALAEARGATLLLAVPSPVLPRRLLARHGFVPTPYRLDFMGRGLTRPLDTRGSRWVVSLGDTDFF